MENNSLRVLAAIESEKPGTIAKFEADKQAAIKEACSGGTPVSCQTMTAAMGTALAWPLLPEAAMTTSAIGAGANAAIQYVISGKVNPDDVLIAGYVGALTANTGLWGTVGWNATGGATSNYIKGDDPLTGAGWGAAGAGLGYLGRKYVIQRPLDKLINPSWKNYEWVDMGIGVSKPLLPSHILGVSGNTGAAAVTEGGAQGGPLILEYLKNKAAQSEE